MGEIRKLQVSMPNRSSRITTVDFFSAIKHFLQFIDKDMHKDILFRVDIVTADATHGMQKYRNKFKINMEKEELLRDVIFFGASLISQTTTKAHSSIFYKSLIKSCASIVEIGTKREFDPAFIEKILKAKSSFECAEQTYFQVESFYFLFKAHFRTKEDQSILT